jgi:peptidoglycan/xylan/chitin deacetylase (PgdA/CDA1 family)
MRSRRLIQDSTQQTVSTFRTINMHFSSLLPAILAISGMATATAIPAPFLESRQTIPAAGVVYSKCSKPGVFALAFDDGPGQYTEELIKTLNAAGAKATFFFTGTLYGCIYNRAAAVKAAYSSGHQVASHTWTHPQTLDSMSVAQLTTEMQKLETALVNIIGVKPTYMRPPYLKTGGNVPAAMRTLGYRMITDSVDSQDWNGLSVPQSEQKFRSAGPSTSDGKGHISLMHETYVNTVRDLVPRLIKWAKENNLKMVTVGKFWPDVMTSKVYSNAFDSRVSWRYRRCLRKGDWWWCSNVLVEVRYVGHLRLCRVGLQSCQSIENHTNGILVVFWYDPFLLSTPCSTEKSCLTVICVSSMFTLPTDGASFPLYCFSEGATAINSNSESSTEARLNGRDNRAEIFAMRLCDCGVSEDLL